MIDLSLDKQISIFLNEVLEKRVVISLFFAVITLAVVGVGINWPKEYESESSVLWSNRDPARAILQQPVSREDMEVRIHDQVDIAREIIYSNKILDEIIEKSELDADADGNKLDRRQLELVKGHLKLGIRIFNRGAKLIAIAYRNKDPQLAYLIVSNASELFIRETRAAKNKASQHAYDFIDRQVLDYKNKLDDVNRRIIVFRKKNVELDSDTRSSVNTRVNNLKASIRATKLSLNEARVQKHSLEEQLVTERQRIEQQLLAESHQASTVERVSANTERLLALQTSLDELRLSYTENYPDIVQIKEQIKNLKIQMQRENDEPISEIAVETNQADVPFVESQLYTQLAGEISDTETNIQTLIARIADSEGRLTIELERTNKVNALESQLVEMTRDLDVTQNIYDDLLTRRENARVSLNLQLESDGTRFKLQEPASVPLVPVGIRFLHFVLGSFPVGVLVPLGILYGLLFIDKRVRHEDSIDDEMLALPVIGVVGHYPNSTDLKHERNKNIFSVLIFVATFGVVAILVYLKLNQVLGT